MSDERDVERGRQARAVLESPVYLEAHDAIEGEIVRLWRESKNAEDREQLHALLGLHGKLKSALEGVMRSGEVAKAELIRKRGRMGQALDALIR